MNNNKNLIVVLIGGFLIASVVAILVQVALKSAKKEPEKIELTQILVAAKDLTVGDKIAEGDMKWKSWPEDAIFKGAIQRKEKQAASKAVEGKLLRSMSEGQPISKNVVTKDDSGEFLSASLTQGMRAISISVRSYKLADRLIRPGDYVDLLVTYRVRVNSRNNPEASTIINRYATETVLENVKVLAVDKNSKTAVDEEDEDGKKKAKKTSSKKATVTLELSSEGVEKLVLAEKVGDVDIALRSMGDNEAIAGQRVTTDVEMSKVLTELSTMQGTTSGVRVYSGSSMTEVRGRQIKQASDIDYNVERVSDDDGKTTKQLLREILTEDPPSESEEE